MSTLALALIFFFLPRRYLPFNSIKIFKQPNWKQLPGKIKLHKQNYPDRLRLILGIWALLGSSNNSTGEFGGGEQAIFWLDMQPEGKSCGPACERVCL